jgi:hypothetical protein
MPLGVNDNRVLKRITLNPVGAGAHINDTAAELSDQVVFDLVTLVEDVVKPLHELRIREHKLIDEDKAPALHRDPFPLVAAIKALSLHRA